MHARLPPNCRPFEWSDLTWLAAAWRILIEEYDLMHSNYSAINALLFRQSHGYYLFQHDPPFLIEPLKDRIRMIPTRYPIDWDGRFFERHFQKPCTLFPVADVWLKDFPEDLYTITNHANESDYLYHKEKLQTLRSGKHLTGRRNLLHQLENEHELSLQLLTQNNVQEANQLLKAWDHHFKEQHGQIQTDFLSCQEALDKLSTLPLTGLVGYADDQPIGFCLGELLSARVYLLHFLKELSHPHGIVPYLYQSCAKSLPRSVAWINLEPDLGIAGLAQAKQAYEPDLKLAKWEVALKKD